MTVVSAGCRSPPAGRCRSDSWRCCPGHWLPTGTVPILSDEHAASVQGQNVEVRRVNVGLAASAARVGLSSPGCCTDNTSVLPTKVGPVISQRVGPIANGKSTPAKRAEGGDEEHPVVAEHPDQVAAGVRRPNRRRCGSRQGRSGSARRRPRCVCWSSCRSRPTGSPARRTPDCRRWRSPCRAPAERCRPAGFPLPPPLRSGSR